MAHILVIDPDTDIGTVTVEYLSEVFGFEVIHVSEFETADRLLEVNEFDAVVMEPATNYNRNLQIDTGLTWYNIKQVQNFKLPIIFFSAVSDIVRENGAYNTPVISKPYLLQLGNKLRDLLPEIKTKRNTLTMKHKISVFISYAREDVASARVIYQILEQAGYKPWLDEIDITPGQDWDIEIGKAIEAAQFFIACMSRKSVSKEGYFQKELKGAIKKLDNMPESAIYLIPVRLDDCTVPRRFSHIHYIDFYKDKGPQLLRKSVSYGCEIRGLLD